MSKSGGGAAGQGARAEEVAAVVAGSAPRGFRFAVTKAADEQAPPGLDKQIFDAVEEGKLDELLGLCQEWAGHSVIDAYKVGDGSNALLVAVFKGRDACVRVLIAAKADVAYANSDHMTALHVAASKGHASLCRVLIDEGASPMAGHFTPLEVAKARGNAECVAILEAAAAAGVGGMAFNFNNSGQGVQSVAVAHGGNAISDDYIGDQLQVDGSVAGGAGVLQDDFYPSSDAVGDGGGGGGGGDGGGGGEGGGGGGIGLNLADFSKQKPKNRKAGALMKSDIFESTEDDNERHERYIIPIDVTYPIPVPSSAGLYEEDAAKNLLEDVLAKHAVNMNDGLSDSERPGAKLLVEKLCERVINKMKSDGVESIATMTDGLKLIDDMGHIAGLDNGNPKKMACESVILAAHCKFWHLQGEGQFLTSQEELLMKWENFDKERSHWWRAKKAQNTPELNQKKWKILLEDLPKLLEYSNALVHTKRLLGSHATLKHTVDVTTMTTEGKIYQNGKGRSMHTDCRLKMFRGKDGKTTKRPILKGRLTRDNQQGGASFGGFFHEDEEIELTLQEAVSTTMRSILPEKVAGRGGSASSSQQAASAEELAAVIAGTAPRGFRFAVTKAADEQAPRGLDKQIWEAASEGEIDELLGLCQQWAGHPVIDAYKDEDGSNALIIAACRGHPTCVRALIAAKAEVAYADDNGMTALHCAAYNNHAYICRMLVDEGASLTVINRKGTVVLRAEKTPLELARAKGNAECVAILEAAAAYAFVDEHLATTRGFRFDVTKAADEQAPPGVDKQIFDAAAVGERLDELLGLCQEWAGHKVIDAYKDELGTNALLYAAFYGHEARVRVLIAAKADLAYTDDNGLTALHYAAFKGRTSTCRVLIDEGASLTAVDKKGQTPKELAKARGQAACVAILEADVADTASSLTEEEKLQALAKIKCEERPWHRARLMIVGQGGAGKTSLLRALSGKPHQANQLSTIGMDTENFKSVQAKNDYLDLLTLAEAGGSFEHLVGWRALSIEERQLLLRRAVAEQAREANNTKAHIELANRDVAEQARIAAAVAAAQVEEEEEEEEEGGEEEGHSKGKDEKELRADFPAAIFAPTTAVVATSDAAASTSASALFVEKEAEENSMTMLDDLKYGEADSIILSVCDLGGQKIFQSLQHILLTDSCLYLLVFDLKKVWEELVGGASSFAQDFIKMWLQQLSMTATGARVFIIGTHQQEFEESCLQSGSSVKEGLNLVDAKLSDLLSNHSKLTLESNSFQGLNFFPVESSARFPGSNDTICSDFNILKLQNLIEQTARELKSVTEHVKNWYFPTFDELQKRLKEGQKYLSKVDVLKIAQREAKKLGIYIPSAEDQEDSEDSPAEVRAKDQRLIEDQRCKDMLKTFHQKGVIIFFDDNDVLENYVVLDPQWLISKCACILRKYDGKQDLRREEKYKTNPIWQPKFAALKEQGVFPASLLRVLLGLIADVDDLEQNYLLEIMLKLRLICPKHPMRVDQLYFAPSVVLSSGSDESAVRDASVGLDLFEDALEEMEVVCNSETSQLFSKHTVKFSLSIPKEMFMHEGLLSRFVVTLCNNNNDSKTSSRCPQPVFVIDGNKTTPCAFDVVGVKCVAVAIGGHLCVLHLGSEANTIGVMVSFAFETSSVNTTAIYDDLKQALREINDQFCRGYLANMSITSSSSFLLKECNDEEMKEAASSFSGAGKVVVFDPLDLLLSSSNLDWLKLPLPPDFNKLNSNGKELRAYEWIARRGEEKGQWHQIEGKLVVHMEDEFALIKSRTFNYKATFFVDHKTPSPSLAAFDATTASTSNATSIGGGGGGKGTSSISTEEFGSEAVTDEDACIGTEMRGPFPIAGGEEEYVTSDELDKQNDKLAYDGFVTWLSSLSTHEKPLTGHDIANAARYFVKEKIAKSVRDFQMGLIIEKKDLLVDKFDGAFVHATVKERLRALLETEYRDCVTPSAFAVSERNVEMEADLERAEKVATSPSLAVASVSVSSSASSVGGSTETPSQVPAVLETASTTIAADTVSAGREERDEQQCKYDSAIEDICEWLEKELVLTEMPNSGTRKKVAKYLYYELSQTLETLKIGILDDNVLDISNQEYFPPDVFRTGFFIAVRSFRKKASEATKVAAKEAASGGGGGDREIGGAKVAGGGNAELYLLAFGAGEISLADREDFSLHDSERCKELLEQMAESPSISAELGRIASILRENEESCPIKLCDRNERTTFTEFTHEMRKGFKKMDILLLVGHGNSEGFMFTEEKARAPQLINAKKDVFLNFLPSGKIELLFLNFCRSFELAVYLDENKKSKIPFIVGWDGVVRSITSVAFSLHFFDALSRGRGYIEAYDDARLFCIQENLTGGDASPFWLTSDGASSSHTKGWMHGFEGFDEVQLVPTWRIAPESGGGGFGASYLSDEEVELERKATFKKWGGAGGDMMLRERIENATREFAPIKAPSEVALNFLAGGCEKQALRALGFAIVQEGVEIGNKAWNYTIEFWISKPPTKDLLKKIGPWGGKTPYFSLFQRNNDPTQGAIYTVASQLFSAQGAQGRSQVEACIEWLICAYNYRIRDVVRCSVDVCSKTVFCSNNNHEACRAHKNHLRTAESFRQLIENLQGLIGNPGHAKAPSSVVASPPSSLIAERKCRATVVDGCIVFVPYALGPVHGAAFSDPPVSDFISSIFKMPPHEYIGNGQSTLLTSTMDDDIDGLVAACEMQAIKALGFALVDHNGKDLRAVGPNSATYWRQDVHLTKSLLVDFPKWQGGYHTLYSRQVEGSTPPLKQGVIFHAANKLILKAGKEKNDSHLDRVAACIKWLECAFKLLICGLKKRAYGVCTSTCPTPPPSQTPPSLASLTYDEIHSPCAWHRKHVDKANNIFELIGLLKNLRADKFSSTNASLFGQPSTRPSSTVATEISSSYDACVGIRIFVPFEPDCDIAFRFYEPTATASTSYSTRDFVFIAASAKETAHVAKELAAEAHAAALAADATMAANLATKAVEIATLAVTKSRLAESKGSTASIAATEAEMEEVAKAISLAIEASLQAAEALAALPPASATTNVTTTAATASAAAAAATASAAAATAPAAAAATTTAATNESPEAPMTAPDEQTCVCV